MGVGHAGVGHTDMSHTGVGHAGVSHAGAAPPGQGHLPHSPPPDAAARMGCSGRRWGMSLPPGGVQVSLRALGRKPGALEAGQVGPIAAQRLNRGSDPM